MDEIRRFEDMHLGDSFGPLTFVITQEMVERYLQASEDDNRELYQSAFGESIAPPTFPDIDILILPSERYTYAARGSAHTKHEVEFLRSIPLGKPVTIESHLVEKYERRGGQYIVLDFTCRDEHGVELIRGKTTNRLSMQDKRM